MFSYIVLLLNLNLRKLVCLVIFRYTMYLYNRLLFLTLTF